MKIQNIHRKPDSIKFTIKKISKCFSLDLHTKLKNIFKLPKEEIDNILDKFGLNKVEEKVNYIINTNTYKNQGIKSLSSYLFSALEKNYITSEAKVSANKLPQVQICDARNLTNSRRINQTKLQDNIKKIIIFVRNNIETIPATYKDLFIFSIKNNAIYSKFIEYKFDSDEIMQKLIMFYQDQWHTLIPSEFWDLYYEKV